MNISLLWQTLTRNCNGPGVTQGHIRRDVEVFPLKCSFCQWNSKPGVICWTGGSHSWAPQCRRYFRSVLASFATDIRGKWPQSEHIAFTSNLWKQQQIELGNCTIKCTLCKNLCLHSPFVSSIFYLQGFTPKKCLNWSSWRTLLIISGYCCFSGE